MKPVEISIKPLSVNRAWQGRRFKTPAYVKYERDLLLMLPVLKLPEPPYEILLWFGISAASDGDNPLKPTLDILSKKYGFNDKLVHKFVIEKVVVKKGSEFIMFEIRHFKSEFNKLAAENGDPWGK